MPAAPPVQPAKRDFSVPLLVKIVSAALWESIVAVKHQITRPAYLAWLVSIKKSRDKHRASHAFLELSTINSEKVLAIRAHLDSLPTRQSSLNATRASWVRMHQTRGMRRVFLVFQVCFKISPDRSCVTSVRSTHTALIPIRTRANFAM